jgi:hypothetical protein
LGHTFSSGKIRGRNSRQLRGCNDDDDNGGESYDNDDDDNEVAGSIE